MAKKKATWHPPWAATCAIEQFGRNKAAGGGHNTNANQDGKKLQ